MCKSRCKGDGKSVRRVGRLCSECYDSIIKDGTMLLGEALGHKPLEEIDPDTMQESYYDYDIQYDVIKKEKVYSVV